MLIIYNIRIGIFADIYHKCTWMQYGEYMLTRAVYDMCIDLGKHLDKFRALFEIVLSEPKEPLLTLRPPEQLKNLCKM